MGCRKVRKNLDGTLVKMAHCVIAMGHFRDKAQ